MIIDAHCHAWRYWPYEPAVPDPEQRGSLEQLLFEMDCNGVDQALLVCANIAHNPDNNLYVAQAREGCSERIHQLVDLDSFWSPTYRTAGAADRLEALAKRWPIAGFTHYLAADDDGAWLLSAEGLALFEVAAQRNLLASIHCSPAQLPTIMRVAQHFPTLPILLHHMGHVKVANEGDLEPLLVCAQCDNLYIKISGFYYGTAGPKWDFPYPDMLPVVRQLYKRFGAQRLCWGSDYPVVSRFMTYQQTLELFRTHCGFIPAREQAGILGENLRKLLT